MRTDRSGQSVLNGQSVVADWRVNRRCGLVGGRGRGGRAAARGGRGGGGGRAATAAAPLHAAPARLAQRVPPRRRQRFQAAEAPLPEAIVEDEHLTWLVPMLANIVGGLRHPAEHAVLIQVGRPCPERGCPALRDRAGERERDRDRDGQLLSCWRVTGARRCGRWATEAWDVGGIMRSTCSVRVSRGSGRGWR